ncbi:MAG: hypothetical protein PHQ23_02400, partial [Candidatus Wallbacteria bacterium]|nr:hypothetical protein [Candidatus Wallbacteria bacterium]
MRTLLLMMTLVAALHSFCSTDADRYLILRQKLCCTRGLTLEQADALKADITALEQKIVQSQDCTEIFSRNSKIERLLLAPLYDALLQQNRTGLDYSSDFENKISAVRLDEFPAITVEVLYFAGEDGRKIEFERIKETAADIQYPIIDGKLWIKAVASVEVESLPVIIECPYTREVLSNTVFLDLVSGTGETWFYEKQLNVTDLYPFWPGLNGNPKDDGIREYATLTGHPSYEMTV